MEDMIRRIVEVDRRAQQVLDKAQQEKLEAEGQITEKVLKLRENYLDQARRRIQIDTENDRTLFEQRWKRRQKYFDKQSGRLQERYAEKHDAWLATIVENATRPTPSPERQAKNHGA